MQPLYSLAFADGSRKMIQAVISHINRKVEVLDIQ